MTEHEWFACDKPDDLLDFITPLLLFSWLTKRYKASDRKLGLFACACCRRIWPLVKDARSREAVDVMEEFLDGRASLLSVETAERGNETVCTTARDAAQVIVEKALPYLRTIREDTASLSFQQFAEKAINSPKCWESVREATVISRGWASASAEWEASLSVGFAASVNLKTHFRASLAAKCAAEAAAWATIETIPWDSRFATERKAQAEMLRDIVGNPFRPSKVNTDKLHRSGSVSWDIAHTIYANQAFDDLPVLADALEEIGWSDPSILKHCREPTAHARGCWVVDLILGRK